MDDRASVKQLSSVRLQKAINKNQIFDTELQKELQVLEIKKKASEKAFELKRTQFLKNRLCCEPLKKSHSFHRPGNGRQLILMNGLLDLRSSYSTGNLLESLRSPRKDQSWGIGNSSEQSVILFKKFNLDVAKDDTGKKDDVANWGKTFEKPMGPNLTRSYSYNGMLQGTEMINDNTVGTDRRSCSDATSFKTLKVPSIASKMSSSDDNLSTRKNRQDTYDFQRRERLKSWHTSNRMTISPITKPLSQKDEGQGLSREDEGGTKAKKHLSLPPLKRTRSKSLEIVRVPDKDENVSEFHEGSGAQNAHSPVPARTLFGSETNLQRSKRNSWVSETAVFERSSKKSQASDDGREEGKKNLKPKKTERPTSTPDLMDIEPEVEYLLMRDDKIRLQRMRASVHAIRLMSDMKDYRYIRNVEFTHQNKREPNSSPNMVSGENQPSYDAQIGVLESEALENPDPEGNENDETQESREIPSNNPVLEPTDVEGKEHDEKPNQHSGEESSYDTKTGEDVLNRSTDSNLAEMFDEIRHTRYLRLRPRMTSWSLDDGGDDEVDDDEFNIPYGRVPLIIVGHTKAVLDSDEDL